MSKSGAVIEKALVRPQGAISAANADEFRQELQDLMSQGKTNLEINLSDVDMIDSRALAVFIVCHQALSAKNGTLTVTGANEDLRGLFHVMRLDEHFSVTD